MTDQLRQGNNPLDLPLEREERLRPDCHDVAEAVEAGEGADDDGEVEVIYYHGLTEVYLPLWFDILTTNSRLITNGGIIVRHALYEREVDRTAPRFFGRSASSE